MIEKNYKLIYEMRSYQSAVYEAQRGVHAAEQKVRDAQVAFWDALDKKLGAKTNRDERNVSCCMADGISRHVYMPNVTPGVGKRHCVFCGLDDFDD